jgi:hypothetical protein
MFSAFPFTLARSVNQNEPAASNPRNRALQFELEQPRQQVRDVRPDCSASWSLVSPAGGTKQRVRGPAARARVDDGW